MALALAGVVKPAGEKVSANIMKTTQTDKAVVITRCNLFNGRGVLTPFKWLYKLEGETPSYEGTPLASLRRIAKRLADARGATVVEAWK